MLSLAKKRNRAFSLIELVIVVVIIGIIAAIAIPRMSRGAAGANDSALTTNLAVLRKAIDLFQAEHNGNYPSLAKFNECLTEFSNEAGDDFVTTKDATHPYGPYLRAIPVQTVAAGKGLDTVTASAGAGGWWYTAASGAITANATTETDGAGKKYIDY